jgi:UDP-N-acetylmuramoyl-L-alanyl-D-glutamate--2,6-diaminopimelate ligase
MRFRDLVDQMPITAINGSAPERVTGITKDSRAVREGFVFFATGSSASFVSEAMKRGAKVVVSDRIPEGDVPCLVITPDVRLLLARMAARFYGHPSRKLHVTGITGTNGKTTITYLIESIVRASGREAGVIGTISCRYKDHVIRKPNTTPESAEIQDLLDDMAREGIGYVAMEVSSHALDQGRVEDIDFDCAIFTNLTHDHLDYHVDFDHYRHAKSILFNRCLRNSAKEKKWAVMNLDDPSALSLMPSPPVMTLGYSLRQKADAHIVSAEESIHGISFVMSITGREIRISTPLVGFFNVSNILAAALFGSAAGMDVETIKKGIESLPGVPGRVERVPTNKGFYAFVDYAHTPDALRKTLETLNRVRSGRLITVFGCGGDRDRTKRPVMGRIASDLSDCAIVTSDNPRTEDPVSIIHQITAGITGNSFKTIEDRRQAIAEALAMAREDDVVLIAGKGHEDYQIIGTASHPFSDRLVVEECLGVAH